MIQAQFSALKLQVFKMETAVVQQFLNFFQDFINLCQRENWPDNDTSEAEIKNAFLISQHVEKCLYRLQKRDIINEFLTVLHSKEQKSNNLLKNCLSDPPKYILKKIINSNTKINQMDVGFQLFLELFSEDKLENYLADLMLEAASKDTLLKNINQEISQEDLLEFKTKILLSALNSCESDVLTLIENCSQDTVELLVLSLLNTEKNYQKGVKSIADAFLTIVLSKDTKYKQFWRQLFKVDDKYFLEMCVENADIFTYIVGALLDCGKLLKEGMSSECFYINLSESELSNIVKRIGINESLKCQFLSIVHNCDKDVEFWSNIL